MNSRNECRGCALIAEGAMKDLIKKYLDRGISRRAFLSRLSALGLTTSAANTMAGSLSAFQPPEPQAATTTAPWMRDVRGTGGALLAAQLKAAGIEYVFFNPSSGS